VLGLVSVIAIVAGLKVDFRIAAFGVLVVLVLMVLLVVFAKLVSANAAIFLAPVLVFLWTSVVLGSLSTVFLFTNAFFNYPLDIHLVVHPSPTPLTLPTPRQPAITSAQALYEDLDNAKYAAAYAMCTDNITNLSNLQSFAQTVKANRDWRGNIIDRKVTNADSGFTPQGAPSGEYVHVVFTSKFTNGPAAVEDVVLRLNATGDWGIWAFHIYPTPPNT
jgi:hypothetical protein